MDPVTIKSRVDLARHLQAQMLAASTPWGVDEDEGEPAGRTSLKTYLLEAHQDAQDDGPAATLARVGKPLGIDVGSTDDPDLVHLRHDGDDLWCDTSLGRFWRLHSIAPVQHTDKIRERLVGFSHLLDNVWLSPSTLEHLPERLGSEMLTFSLSHDRRKLNAETSVAHEFDFVTMRLWASMAQRKLQRLREAALFPRGVSVRSVRLRSGANGESVVAEYFNHGKVTASGNSFDAHSRVLVNLLRDYRAEVETIENAYGIGFEQDERGHFHLAGNPVTITAQWAVDDLEFAVDRIFAAVEPFRLWGVPTRVGNHRYQARAVDLHVGSIILFDISPEHISMVLPRGACGNSVVRFLGNLRYHVDADAQLS